MNLLAGTLYDPGTSASKATDTLLQLTALDTTHLRLTFTVPASGTVRVRLQGIVHGASSCPALVLGVLEGSTVRGRQAPMSSGFPGIASATNFLGIAADFLVSGLTPGASLTWDAAYGVETAVGSSGIKYGGPNDTTANNAFGGFAFEVWDVTTQGGGSLSASDIRDAVGLTTANLDAQLAEIEGETDDIAAVKAKTDLLTAHPADRGDLPVTHPVRVLHTPR